jgi:hypothetical protein
MANEFARNIQDTDLTITRALPTADGTVTSADFDLGADIYKSDHSFAYINAFAIR